MKWHVVKWRQEENRKDEVACKELDQKGLCKIIQTKPFKNVVLTKWNELALICLLAWSLKLSGCNL